MAHSTLETRQGAPLLAFINSALRTYRKLRKSDELPLLLSRALFALALAIGTIAQIFAVLPKWLATDMNWIAITCLCVAALTYTYLFYRHWKAPIFNADRLELGIRRPWQSTTAFSKLVGDTHQAPIGGVIPAVDFQMRAGVGVKQGLEPTEVKLSKLGQFDEMTLPEELRQSPIADKWNEKKYILGKMMPYVTDRADLELELIESDWNHVIPYTRFVVNSDAVRHKFSFFDPLRGMIPANNLVPSSLCLHVIASFEDNSVLAMNRSPGVEAYRNAERAVAAKGHNISISFEEQLSELDFPENRSKNSAEDWVRRALCEEVFPLRDKYRKDAKNSWNLINDYVSSMKVWGLIFEETVAGWSIMAHVRLSMPWQEFRSIYLNMAKFAEDVRDPEGNYLVIPAQEIHNLIQSGECHGHSLSNDAQKILLSTDSLHASSLCRAIYYDRLLSSSE